MSIEIKVPQLGESVTEATISKWLKKIGEMVSADEPLVELETDKVTLEVNAPSGGVLEKIIVPEGDDVAVGAVVALFNDRSSAQENRNNGLDNLEKETVKETANTDTTNITSVDNDNKSLLSPAVKILVEENNLNLDAIKSSGKGGRLTKSDVIKHLENLKVPKKIEQSSQSSEAREERVKMSRLRRRIADRLKEAQNTAAMLTTFNEVDMSAVISARKKFQDVFVEKNQIKLGFMSFFVKASVIALKEQPTINASLEGDEIVYKNHYDIGVAVSAPQGLVVPVVKDCDLKSFTEIEKNIFEYGIKAKEGKLMLEEMSGGTFTISNGGIYGSMLSTPIINTPQSAILGMHNIVKRPVVDEKDDIVVKPIMYLALSYDHRIIDGREAVTFLVRIKESLENPERMLYEI
ncbi:MAG: dihydrolipoamide succinyltransferase [Alphaproteobacteria bacterium TMED87]|nr:dihydrolipoyllysine-residue succinyltransferase [Rhodospirillaceae bacterium]OUV09746.1 MAG: dihydrolipoamide succinyltransferase [Alphaproteobacteria bacterium TMED87]